MSALTELLGEKIAGKNGDKEVAELAGEGKVVGLYFSAHWCPPCRAFTPQLATWYKKFKDGEKGSSLDIVFVSSDRDQDGFDEYYKDMPWLALPYDQRDRKAKLSSKFKVSGIPTLVMLDAQTGKVITKDGRAIVADDPEGKDFPWSPKSFLDIIKVASLISDTEGTEKKWDDVEVSYVGIYFSAHWCGPCRAFTPKLIETYQKLNKEAKKFEIVFVSSDRDEDSFKEYYGTMPWLAVKYADTNIKALSRLFAVSGIPMLVILDRTTGAVINDSGRGAVGNDPDGEDFPWFPKPVEELGSYTVSLVNERPSLIWLTDESKEESKKALEVMMPIAKEYLEETKDLEADEKLAFMYSGPNTEDLSGSIRSFLNLPDKKTPLLFITNIPEQQKYICEEDKITADVVRKVVEDFKAEKLTWKPMRD